MTDVELELLVLEAQSGNAQAFTRLYKHFYSPMKKYALLRARDNMAADDAVQNVWVKVSKRIVFLRDITLFKSWLYRALRWELVDLARKNKKEVLTNYFEESPSSEKQTTSPNNTLSLLSNLHPNEKEVAELYYLNDLTIKDISLITGYPEGTVKSRLNRARTNLRKLI